MLLKAGYGSAEIGLTAIEVMLQVYLLELYVSVGLDPLWAGIALATAVLWDALSDPVMGILSDRTPARTARGKRLPYLLLGLPLCVVAFVFLFSPSVESTESSLFWRLLGAYLILNTAMTLIIVPYLSLISDLAKGSDERVGYFGWRLGFSGVGLIVGLVVPTALAYQAGLDLTLADTGSVVENRSRSSVWISVICVVTLLLAVGVVWNRSGCRRPREMVEKGHGLWSVFEVAWSSMSFKWVVGAFVFISLGRSVNASLALIFYKGTLELDEVVVSMALVGLSVTVMVATPLWVGLSRHFDKRWLCLIGSLALSLLTAIVYPLMPPGAIGPVVFIVVSGGVAASSVVLLEALFSDVVEEDGKRTQVPLAGSYYGLWRLSTKVARAGGLAVSGGFLSIIGYQEGNVTQPESVYRSVAWAFGPGVAVFFLSGSLLLWNECRCRKKPNTAF